MRICKNCGSEFDEAEEYCPECGAPVEYEEEYYEDTEEDLEEHLKICPQCGDSIPLDSDICPSCQYVFRTKPIDKKKFIYIGAGAVLLALVVFLCIKVFTKSEQPIAIVSPTEAPVIETQAPAMDATLEPVVEATEVPVQNSAATSNDVLAPYHDEVITVFELLETASAGEESVTITSPDGENKVVSVGTAETYLTKLLSLVFGEKAGFEYKVYRSQDGNWRLILSGGLNNDQISKMLSLEDENIYATFRNMYLNSARQIISSAVRVQPQIMLNVYPNGKTAEEYALRIVETDVGNGTVSRAETN